jgi:hypothetical protein
MTVRELLIWGWGSPAFWRRGDPPVLLFIYLWATTCKQVGFKPIPHGLRLECIVSTPPLFRTATCGPVLPSVPQDLRLGDKPGHRLTGQDRVQGLQRLSLNFLNLGSPRHLVTLSTLEHRRIQKFTIQVSGDISVEYRRYPRYRDDIAFFCLFCSCTQYLPVYHQRAGHSRKPFERGKGAPPGQVLDASVRSAVLRPPQLRPAMGARRFAACSVCQCCRPSRAGSTAIWYGMRVTGCAMRSAGWMRGMSMTPCSGRRGRGASKGRCSRTSKP